MVDTLFILYIIFLIIVLIISFHPIGIKTQQEFLAFSDTQRYMKSRGVK